MNARDARKQLQEEERRREEASKNGKKDPNGDPQSGKKTPSDPAKRGDASGHPEDSPEGNPRRNDVPGWVVALPPEVRDALAGGRAENVPEKYRSLIRAYTLWLQKNQKSDR